MKSCVLLAGLPADGPTVGDRARAQPRPHRASAGPGRRGDRPRRRADRGRHPGRARAGLHARARRSLLRRVPPRRRRAGARLADRDLRHERELDAHGLRRIARAHGRRSCSATSSRRPGEIPTEEPVGELDVAAGPLVGTVVEPERSRWPSTSCRWWRCWVLRRGRDRGPRRGELRVKESDRIATVVDGLRGLGARSRPPTTASSSQRHRRAARRHDRLARRPPAGDARRGRRPGEPRGRHGRRDGGRRGAPTPASSATWRRCCELRRRRLQARGRGQGRGGVAGVLRRRRRVAGVPAGPAAGGPAALRRPGRDPRVPGVHPGRAGAARSSRTSWRTATGRGSRCGWIWATAGASSSTACWSCATG